MDVYKVTYSLMSSHVITNSDVRQLQINGHFCYVLKFVLVTNGLGVLRHIAFIDDDFKKKHLEIPVEKKQHVHTYTYKSLHIYPGILRDSQEWETLYKKRAVIEKSIHTLKDSICLGILKTYNS